MPSADSPRDLLPAKERTPFFACLRPCWGFSSRTAKSRHVSFAEPVYIQDSDYLIEDIPTIPNEFAEDEVFQESFQTEFDAKEASSVTSSSSHHDTMLQRLGIGIGDALCSVDSKTCSSSSKAPHSTTKKQVFEEIFRFFMFVVLFGWMKDQHQERIQQDSQSNARDPVANTSR